MARSVLPRVRARGQSDEDARLLVVGAGTEDITALRGLPGVEVVGHASDEEVALLLARAKVCPLTTVLILLYCYTAILLYCYTEESTSILSYCYTHTQV